MLVAVLNMYRDVVFLVILLNKRLFLNRLTSQSEALRSTFNDFNKLLTSELLKLDENMRGESR